MRWIQNSLNIRTAAPSLIQQDGRGSGAPASFLLLVDNAP